MKHKRPAVAIIMTTLLACAVGAEPNPEAGRAMSRAIEKITTSRTYSYSFHRYGTGALSAAYPALRGTAVLVPNPEDASFALRRALVREETPSGTIVTVVRDGLVTRWDPNQAKLSRAPIYRNGLELLEESVLAPFFLLGEIQQAAETGTVEAREERLGRTCNVVASHGATLDYRWWIDAEEGSLVRVEVTSEKFGDGAAILELTETRTDASYPDDFFEIQVPSNTASVEFSGQYPAIGEAAPSWTVITSDGQTLSLEDFRGMVVIMDFWATWCRGCLLAMPHLQRLHEKYGDDLVVVGLSWKETGDPEAVAGSKGVNYLLAEGDGVGESYSVTGLPLLFVVGRDGRLVDFFNGYLGKRTEDQLDRTVAAALAR